MTEFYFIRHGDADYSEKGSKIYKNQGAFMCTLSQKGIEQAKQAANAECLQDAELIITSPFGRALHTAGILSKELQLDFVVETDLHEWLADAINYEYLDKQTSDQYYAEFRANKGNFPEREIRPYETAQSMKARVFPVLEKYKTYKKVIVVCHGTLMEFCLNIPHPDNCQIHKIKL